MGDSMPSRSAALWRIVRLTWLADPLRAIASITLSLLDALTPILVALGVREVVTAASGGNGRSLLSAGSLIAVGVLGGQLLGFASFAVGMSLRERAAHRLELDVLGSVARRPGLAHFEDQEYLDRVGLLLEGVRGLAGLQDAALLALTGAVRITAALTLLATVDPRLALLGVLGLAIVAVQPRADRITDARDLARMPLQRRAAILDWYVRTAGPARELRLLGAQAEIARRIADDRAQADHVVNSSNVRIAALESAANCAFGLGVAAAIALTARQVAQGQLEVGAIALVAVIAVQLSGQFSAISELFSNLLEVVRAADHHRRLLHVTPEGHVPAVAASLEGQIELEKASFTYPGASRPAVQDVNLRVPAGMAIALVGDNGAGKSTLVDLLCGLREPTTGTVHAPATVSGAFQDPARLDLSVQEVVGIGDLVGADTPRIIWAIEEAGGQFVHELPRGIETSLGTSFEGGVELSGGQWQRLGLARALLPRAPDLVVLDEPTANLDPHAEDEVLRRTIIRSKGGQGRPTTVLVTHRLAAARLADLIVVMKDGRIHEQGQHAELMHAGGWYAQAFESQAAGYR